MIVIDDDILPVIETKPVMLLDETKDVDKLLKSVRTQVRFHQDSLEIHLHHTTINFAQLIEWLLCMHCTTIYNRQVTFEMFEFN